MGLLYEAIGRGPTAGDKLWRINWPLLAVVSTLAGIGIATLYSVAGGTFHPWAERHALRFLIGLAGVLVIALLPLRALRLAALPAYAIALMLLVLVPLIGVEALGARRWLSVAGLSLQPSEIMKVALVAMLAAYYQWLPPGKISQPLWVLPPLAMIAVPVALTIRQPDLGTALLLGGVGLGLMAMAGVSLWYFVAGLAGAAMAAPVLYAGLHDYQRRRIEVFLDPGQDPLGAGYHVTQAKIALGSGGLAGKGFMGGTQSQLDFVPEKHTDFIFVMLAEEWGFIGALTVLGLYGTMIVILYGMALSARGPQQTFSRLLIVGAALTVGAYAMVNVAMVTGLVPVVGVPLPLVSYGGTSMFTALFAIALALAAHVNRAGSEHFPSRARLRPQQAQRAEGDPAPTRGNRV